jgi:hypothetical protein
MLVVQVEKFHHGLLEYFYQVAEVLMHVHFASMLRKLLRHISQMIFGLPVKNKHGVIK